MGRLLKKTIIGMALLLVVLCGGCWIYLNSLLPELDGTVVSSSVKKQTTITRDQWGVPHISASSKEDAYFAFGYTIAQDRLFQMDLQRRLARGELSEILGESLLNADKMFRTLMLRRWAEDYLQNEQAITPEVLVIIDSFIDGINFYIKAGQYPIEYKLLGYKPRLFTRVDCVAMAAYMAYSFAEGIKRDSLHTMLEHALTSADLETIFADHTLENRATIINPGGMTDNQKSTSLKSDEQQNNTTSKTVVSKETYRKFLVSLQTTLRNAANINPPFAGSNSWVLSPSRSKSGHALLANDPHIGIANPGVWYEVHIIYPGYENYGYHIPLVPLPMLAHNSIKGWAITMLENDDMDLYAETFHPQKPNLVKYKGSWVKIKTYEEQIKVKGKEKAPLTIRVTPHGPVISDFIKGYAGKPVAVNWIALQEENPVLNVMYDMAIAENVNQFENAVSKLVAPGLNISYADNKGNIAWWSVGRFPVRPAHVSGKEIHDGSTGKDDWLGLVPFKLNPRLINPENGQIITANHLPTLKPVGRIPVLTGYFRPSDRAARIHELLSRKNKWSIEELMAVQTDTTLWSGIKMKKGLLKVLETHQNGFNSGEKKALSALKSWDGSMGLDSVGGSVFQFTTYHVLKNSLEAHLGKELLSTYLNMVDHWDYLKRVLNDKAMPIQGKDPSITPIETDDLILSGFKNAVQEMSTKLGENESDWQWGKIHTVEYVHPIGRKKPFNLFFNVGPFPSPAEFTSVNKMKSKIGKHDYKVSSLPSTRRLIDMGNPENSWSILPTGNSGNAMSEYYDNQAEMYLKGEYRMINFSNKQIEQSKSHEIILKPSDSEDPR